MSNEIGRTFDVRKVISRNCVGGKSANIKVAGEDRTQPTQWGCLFKIFKVCFSYKGAKLWNSLSQPTSFFSLIIVHFQILALKF